MADNPILDDLVSAAETALAAKDPEYEVMVLIQGAAWSRIYAIKSAVGGAAIELSLDEDGQSKALIAATAVIGIKSLAKHDAPVGFGRS